MSTDDTPQPSKCTVAHRTSDDHGSLTDISCGSTEDAKNLKVEHHQDLRENCSSSRGVKTPERSNNVKTLDKLKDDAEAFPMCKQPKVTPPDADADGAHATTEKSPTSLTLPGDGNITGMKNVNNGNIPSLYVKMILFSLLLFVAPLATLYHCQTYMFKGDATFSAIAAIVVANLVLIVFVVVAMCESDTERHKSKVS